MSDEKTVILRLSPKVVSALSRAAIREKTSLEEIAVRGLESLAERWDSMLALTARAPADPASGDDVPS